MLNTAHFVSWLQGLLAPLFLGGVGIAAIFFLFSREIIRFVQFIALAISIAIVFYTPWIVHTLASALVGALGLHA